MRKIISLLALLTLCSCASYKSTWDCPKIKGIGCSSIEYADWIAREQIITNKETVQGKSCTECEKSKGRNK